MEHAYGFEICNSGRRASCGWTFDPELSALMINRVFDDRAYEALFEFFSKQDWRDDCQFDQREADGRVTVRAQLFR